METPLSVSVFSQEALSRQNIKSVADLKNSIPNLQMGNVDDSGTAVSICGVTSNDFTEVGESAVSIHVDGAYSPRPQGALALMHDLERVKVLRGPQGTLFGMNSAAGAINIIPAKPDLSGRYGSIDFDIGLDEYNRQEVRGMVNLPLPDNFGLRGTFITRKHDGLMEQASDETDIDAPLYGLPVDSISDVDQRRNHPVSKADYYNNADESAARIMALWDASDRLTFLLTLDHFSDQGAGYMDFVDCEQAAGTDFACTHDLRWAQINVPDRKDMTIDDTRLHISYDLNDSMALEYRYSLQDQKRSEITDIDSGNHYGPVWGSYGDPLTPEGQLTYAYPISDSPNETVHSNYETTSHEIQWKSTGDSALQYVISFFQMEEVKSIRYDVEELTYKTGYGPDEIDDLPDTQIYDQSRRTTESTAIFGQLDYKFNEEWSATLGYRSSDDKKTDTNSNTYARWRGDTAWYNGEHTPATVGDHIKTHQSNDLTWNMGGAVLPLGSGATAPVANNTINSSGMKTPTASAYNITSMTIKWCSVLLQPVTKWVAFMKMPMLVTMAAIYS